MARMKVKDIQKEVNREEDEFYGEETISGSSPKPSSDDDAESALAGAIGPDAHDVVKNHKPFDIDEEVDKDEEVSDDDSE